MPNPLETRQPSSRGAPATGNGSAPQHRPNPLKEREGSRRSAQGSGATRQLPEPQYTVYIRLPYSRNGFVDPPRVDWDASKERYLWKLLSRGNRNTDLDWDAQAAHLQVSRAFLLQQAAWLYERELSQIQAQMRKVGAASLNTNLPPPPPSSIPQSPATPVLLSARPAVSGFEPRITSALSIRSGTTSGGAPTPRASPAPQLLSNRPPRPVSRHTSDTTIGRQTQLQPAAHRFSNPLLDNDDEDNTPTLQIPPAPSSVSEESTVESTSSSSEDEGDNQLIRRLPLFLKKQHSLGSEDEGGDEEPFLPFSAGDTNFSPRDAAMGGTVTLQSRPSTDNSGRNGLDSSRPEVDGYGLRNNSTTRRRSSILDSPRRRAVADSAGPSSPSMGSSFSDLSDASVSQSAMEEAYLSTMNAGGLGSRISTIGRAVGSRYFQQP